MEELQQQDSVGRGTNNPAIIAIVKQHFRLQTTLLTTILAIFGPLQNYKEIYVLILKYKAEYLTLHPKVISKMKHQNLTLLHTCNYFNVIRQHHID